MQAHINAQAGSEEYVMEYLCSHEKIKGLLREIISLDYWLAEIYPSLAEAAKTAHMKRYLVRFHLSAIVNLMEIICFHRTAISALGDNIIDLIDFCYTKIAILISQGNKKVAKYMAN